MNFKSGVMFHSFLFTFSNAHLTHFSSCSLISVKKLQMHSIVKIDIDIKSYITQSAAKVITHSFLEVLKICLLKYHIFFIYRMQWDSRNQRNDTTEIAVFCDVTLCIPVEVYRSFFYPYDRRCRTFWKSRYTSTSSHGITSHKTVTSQSPPWKPQYI
jgi:hypothetical protein